ncbi:MAG: ArnT family glycosyltransferase [Hyphomicrobiales bacterium]
MAKPPKDTETSPGPAEKKTVQKRSAKSAGERKATKDETASALAPKSIAAKKPRQRTKTTASQGTKARAARQAFDPTITQDAAVNAGLWVSPPDMSDETAVAAEPVALQDAATELPSQAAATQAPVAPIGQATNWTKWLPRWSWVDGWANVLTPIFDGLARLRIVAAVCIALVAVAAFAPGFTTIPPIDRDESRFSQATRQMVATGDFVEIRFQNDARYQKPIGIYWLQSAAVHLYGAEDGQAPIWVYRTVSFVGAVAAAVLVYWLALGFGAPPVAFAAGLLVALTVLLGAEARLAKTDAMLFATILVAQGILARAFLGRRDSSVKFWHAGLFWTAAAAGILIKGPILPMVVGSTALVASLFERRIAWLRRLRPGLGIMWMLILTLPWFIAIGITSGGEFYAQSIGRDLFEKIGQSRERPFVPPGAYTFGFFPSLGWPLAPLAFLAIPFAIASWRDKSTRFLVAWIVPTWAIFELSATKLPHYILPIYPALAILAARMMVYEKVPKGWLAGVAKGLFLLIPIAGTIGMPVILYVYGDSISPVGVALMVIGLVLLIGAFLLIVREHARASLVLIVAGTLVLYSGAFGFHVPAARTIWVTPQLVTALDAVRCDEPELATLGYNEPSLVLMTRTDLRTLSSAEAAADFLAQGGCRAAFVDAPFVEEMFEELGRLTPEESTSAATVRLLARVEGININGGDELNMHVFAAGE